METIKQKTLGEYQEKLLTDTAAYQRITALFDEGTFVELGKFVKHSANELAPESSDFEGVITGYGAVEGRLVFVYSQDFSRMKGAVGAAHAKKIAAIYDAALKVGAPVISIIDTAGAKLNEGVDALSGYGLIMNSVAKASGIIPQIAVVCGHCTGAMATIASMADFVIGAKKSGKFFIAPPYVLQDKSGTIEAAAKNGSISIIEEDDISAVTKARKLFTYLPANNTDGITYSKTADDPYRLTVGTTAAEIAVDMVDATTAIELVPAYGKSVKTYLSIINEITVGVIAVDGQLTPADARKAAKLMTVCDNFSIPVVTVVNCPGFEYTSENEKAPFASELAKLSMVYAGSTNAKLTVIVGEAIGSAFTMLGSKSLGADVVFATENANIAAMTTDAAIEFIYGSEFYGAENALEKKEAFTKEWKTKIASPVAAARSGDVDDVIATEEVRARVASTIEMLSCKATKAPFKKHTNMPL